MLTKFQYVVEQIPGYHVAPSAKPGKFRHVARGHVFEWGTSLKMARWRTWGRMAQERYPPGTPNQCSR